ncbi:hypothetical protein STVA_15550 [Allostella vacuolata]|nr:hypothetical protein STVA_15550 [Stella vacuolata]
MNASILRGRGPAAASGSRRRSDVGMVLAICIGTVFVPVIGLCIAAIGDLTDAGPRQQVSMAPPVAAPVP